MPEHYRFYRRCVEWPLTDVDVPGGLVELIDDSLSVSRRTFLAHACRDDVRRLEAALGYARHPRQGLTMARDWHVTYFRSRWHGRRVYGFVHSGIEYVFLPPEG